MYSLLAPNPRTFSLFMLSSGEDEFQPCHHCAHFELSFVMKGVVACHDLVSKREINDWFRVHWSTHTVGYGQLIQE